MKELLFKMVSDVATLELQMALDKFRQLNGDAKFNSLIESLRGSFTLLSSVTDKTKTKIDDTFVSIILNALPKQF